MIDPQNASHRTRLARAMKHWHQQLDVYRKVRRDTVVKYAGSQHFATASGIRAPQKLVWGNLLQQSGLAHQIPLSYNDPRYKVVANMPESASVAPRLQEFLNTFSDLIGLGDIARGIALDSFFGFGIVKVSRGLLSPRAQYATGQRIGPMAWRISQDDWGFDGAAKRWDQVSYMFDFLDMPLDDAMAFEPFLNENPDATLKLQEFTRSHQNTTSRIHSDRHHDRTAQKMTRLVDVYFPHSQEIATWPANSDDFTGVEGEPLWTRPFEGHHSGVYALLSHLDIPDNLIPVAQSESTKAYHNLFNELAEKTAEQARAGKVNPLYEMGFHRDMQKILKTKDRLPAAVSNLQKIGAYEIPGPSQGQTAYMQAALSLFKEFAGNLDDTLGLGPTAATATQSELIRQANTIRSAEARRRMDRVMQEVAWKIAHLALNDPNLTLRARRMVEHTDIDVENDFLPASVMPRTTNVDDFAITLVPYSREMRPPEARLQQLNEALAIIAQFLELKANGVPIEIDKVVELQADYRDMPELRFVVPALLPEFEGRATAHRRGVSDPARPQGVYTRINQSTRSNTGALTQALTQFPENQNFGVSTVG